MDKINIKGPKGSVIIDDSQLENAVIENASLDQRIDEEARTLLYSIGRSLNRIDGMGETLSETKNQTIINWRLIQEQAETLACVSETVSEISSQHSAITRIEKMLRELTMTKTQIKIEEILDTPLTRAKYIAALKSGKKLPKLHKREVPTFSFFDKITRIWFCSEGRREQRWTFRDLLNDFSHFLGDDIGPLVNYLKKYSLGIGPMKANVIAEDMKNLAKLTKRI
jgi:hypothetical protein